VCYGFLIGHVRDNVNAAAEHGIAHRATDPDALTRELAAALREGRRAIPAYDKLPTAAELTVALARGEVGRRARPDLPPVAPSPAETHELARSGR
jgi:hypothetical protein